MEPLQNKHRPRLFSELVGQGKTPEALASVLRNNKIVSTYIFAGSHGCGKTTSARIFAAGLNCQSFDAPTDTPCGKCQSCLAIANGDDIDVSEIDAASNNGVEYARQLASDSNYTPARGRYRVWILDEAHRMTPQAQDALLKTFEEPSSKAVFILCTTEPEKLLPTVLSRSQRYNFKRAPLTELEIRLKQIAADENITVSDEALGAIAKISNGGIRDAVALLGKLAGSNAAITVDSVYDATPGVSIGQCLPLVDAMFRQDVMQVALQYRSLLENSTPEDILNGLSECLLASLHCQTLGDAAKQFIEVSQDTFTKLKVIASKGAIVFEAVETLQKQSAALSRSGSDRNKAIFLEVSLIQLCGLKPVVIDEVPFEFPKEPAKTVEVHTDTHKYIKGEGPAIEELMSALKLLARNGLKDNLVDIDKGVVKVNDAVSAQRHLRAIKDAYDALGYTSLTVTLEEV